MGKVLYAIMALCIGAAIRTRSQDLVITQFTANGSIGWNYPTNSVDEYRIEWSSDLKSGPWSDLAAGMQGMLPTGATMTADVPMFYRIKAMGATPSNMVYIPPSWFAMGQVSNQHRVFISGFCMAKYEVSKAEWDAVDLWASTNGYTWFSNMWADAPDYPLTGLSWYDAVLWCNAKSEKEGLTPCYYTDAVQTSVYRSGGLDLSSSCVKWSANGYRLPTSAEWEKAARGGASSRRSYPWADSDNIQSNRANCAFWYWNSLPVGSFAPNGYGLFDMAGNVNEWCWDWFWNWDEFSYTNPPTIDPCGPDASVVGFYRVRRGGGWYGETNGCTTWSVGQDYPDSRYHIDNGAQGFRFVRRVQ